MVISVGIDVSKDKHDCFIVSSEGEVLADVFTIPNNMDGLHCLLQRIQACATPQDKIKVGLEATGHYSYNLLGFLLDNGLATYVLNPLRTNLYRKSLSLRKTKNDWVDARTIASMLLSDADLKTYTNAAYEHISVPGMVQSLDAICPPSTKQEQAVFTQFVSELLGHDGDQPFNSTPQIRESCRHVIVLDLAQIDHIRRKD